MLCTTCVLRPAPIISRTKMRYQAETCVIDILSNTIPGEIFVTPQKSFCSRDRWAQLARRREEEELVNGARSEGLDDELELHRVIERPGRGYMTAESSSCKSDDQCTSSLCRCSGAGTTRALTASFPCLRLALPSPLRGFRRLLRGLQSDNDRWISKQQEIHACSFYDQVRNKKTALTKNNRRQLLLLFGKICRPS